MIEPAVKGTVGILQSALKHGCAFFPPLPSEFCSAFNPDYSTSVKRIVVTSSCASVLHLSSEPKIFSEKDWNEEAIGVVKEKGKDAPAAAKYRASKTLAEKGHIYILLLLDKIVLTTF